MNFPFSQSSSFPRSYANAANHSNRNEAANRHYSGQSLERNGHHLAKQTESVAQQVFLKKAKPQERIKTSNWNKIEKHSRKFEEMPRCHPAMHIDAQVPSRDLKCEPSINHNYERKSSNYNKPRSDQELNSYSKKVRLNDSPCLPKHSQKKEARRESFPQRSLNAANSFSEKNQGNLLIALRWDQSS